MRAFLSTRLRRGAYRSLLIVGSFPLMCGAMLTIGCASDRPEFTPVRQPSMNANQEFAAAQELYRESCRRGDQGATLRRSRDELVRKLRQVTHLSEQTPLFFSKLGDVRLDLGSDAYSLAHEDFVNAQQLNAYWVPAYLGLARLEMLAGNGEKSEAYLHDAEEALKVLVKASKNNGAARLIASHEDDDQPSEASPGEQLSLFWTWLDWNERWYPENLALGTSMTPDALQRRLRARIEYQRAEIMIVTHRPAVDVIAQLDLALKWDPDFNTATIDKAEQLRRLNQLDEAESLIEPFVRGNGAGPLSRNARMLYEMACIYAARYEADGGERWFDAGTDYFMRLLNDVNPDHAAGLYAYGLHARTGGVRAHRPEFLQKGLEYLDRARQLDPELPRINDERAATAAALNDMERNG